MNGTVITDWGDALRASVANALALLLGGIPRVIGFILILAIGWVISGLIAKLVARVLHQIHFNDLAGRSGLTGFVQQMGLNGDASDFVAMIVKWFVRLIVLVAAFDALGLPAVSAVLESLLLWIPNLIVGIVILVLAGLAANAVSRVVRGAASEGGIGNADMLGKIAAGAIWAFGIIAAVNQIGVAAALVNTLFMGLIGTVALALGLAFGLGGRETAAEIIAKWYQERSTLAALSQGAQAAEERAKGDADNAPASSSTRA